MLGRLQLINAQLQLPKLLATVHCGVLSQLSVSGAYQTPADVRNLATTNALPNEAAVSSPQEEAKQAARELGLDAVPLGQLREMIADALPKEKTSEIFTTPLDPPRLKKLKYTDIEGYQEAMLQLANTPQEYDIPRAPALDAGQWVDTHFKEAGISFEPRSGFYNWRGWAKANLSDREYELLLMTESVMADDSTRSGLLKQAQHELARLWDWQHRRAGLGLSPDVDPAAAAAGMAADEPAAAAAAAATAAAVEVEAQQTAAAAGTKQDLQPNGSSSSSDSSGGSSGGSSGDAAAAAAAAQQQDFSDKGVLELLDATGVLKSDAVKFEDAMQTTDTLEEPAAAAPAWITAVEDVADRPASRAGANRKLSYERATVAREAVERMLTGGQKSAERNKFRELENLKVRQYRPKAHDDDLFLPSRPRGSWKLDKLFSDPKKTLSVNPDKVTRQAVAIVEAAKRAAEYTAVGDAGRAAVQFAGADWLSMPLLDRTVLHEEKLREERARLEAKPKMQRPWNILQLDDYTFDLRRRPPTPCLDLLSSYLEVKYADVLLRKDAVQTLNRQLAIHQLTAASGTAAAAAASEVIESPPAALTAAKTLSPAEREGIVQALDDLLDRQQYQQYRDGVLQLYCDGLVSWGELQQCWAAAESGAELAAAAAAAAEGPIALAEDREQLFRIISGQQQLGSLTDITSSSTSSSSSSAADTAAAKLLWEKAGKKLTATWAEAAAKTSQSSSSSSSSRDAITMDDWSRPVEYQEAQQTWQQLLLIAGLPNGPTLEQVLLAGSSSSSGSDADFKLQQQLRQLQEALQQATGLNAAAAAMQQGSSEEGVPADEFDAWQRLCVAPPTLQDLLKQHWDQVAREELGQEVEWKGPAWQQLWQLLEDLTHNHQQQQQQELAAAAGDSDLPAAADTTASFQRYLREAECAPLTPPPYPGASRLLRWEQTIVLGPTSGQTTTAPELKVKLKVDVRELRKETGISALALRHILRIAGNRFNPSTGLLTIRCERFPTREENRRWCLEVLHRLLQEGQRKHPSSKFLLGPASSDSPVAALA